MALTVRDRNRSRAESGESLASIAYSVPMRLLGLVIEPINRRIGAKRMPYLFVLPNFVLLGLFTFVPVGILFYYSVSRGRSIYPSSREFVGTDNFEDIFDCRDFTDPNSCRADLFWRGLWNTAAYVVVEVGVLLVFSLITAVALNGRIRARGFFRSAFFYPVLLSPVVVALLWKWILQREGILNAGLVEIGLDPTNWLLDLTWSRFWVIGVSVWATLGFYTLILLAGLQGIDPQLYSAARVDGANSLEQFRDITLPLLRPSLLVVLMLATIRSVQAFDVPFVLTGGGPGTRNLFMVQYIYNVGFSTDVRNFGLAATASIVLAVLLVILSYLQMQADRRVRDRTGT